MSPRISRFGRATAAALALLACLLLSGCGDLSRGELTRGVESLSALAAQGELLAAGVARDETKTTYARVMAKTLADQAAHEAEKLADAEPEPAVAAPRDEAVRLADGLAALFGVLRTHPGDEDRGARVVRGMSAAKARAEAIVERLTGEKA